MRASGRPFWAAIKRSYAAQAQAAQGTSGAALPKQKPKVTKLSNGAIIASLENYSPVARIAVLYNAGPRYEPANQQGITHCIRNAVGLSTEKATGFSVTRNIQQIGGTMSCTSTREHMIYTLECTRENIDTGVEFLSQTASKPAFRPWEVTESNKRTHLDLGLLSENPEARLMEALHGAAYRGAMGHSLYCQPHKVGWFTPDMLHDFVNTNYTSGNMAVIGLGVGHDQLQMYAKGMTTNTSPSTPCAPAVYSGDQVRVETNSPLVYAAVACEGVGMGSKDLLALYVLQKVMGSGSYVKYGSDMAGSKVTKAAAAGTNNPFSATCINSTHSDTGLFGFQVVGQAQDMDKMLKSVAVAFGEATKGGITDADVQKAKTQLKAAFAMELEDTRNFMLDFGIQILMSGNALTMDDVSAPLDSITTADVQNVAKKIINGKPCMAAVGDLSNTPHVDQLF